MCKTGLQFKIFLLENHAKRYWLKKFFFSSWNIEGNGRLFEHMKFCHKKVQTNMVANLKVFVFTLFYPNLCSSTFFMPFAIILKQHTILCLVRVFEEETHLGQ